MKQIVKFSKSDLNSFIKQVKSLNMKDVKKSIYEDNILAIVKHNNLSLVMNNTETEIIADFSCESESEFEFLLSLKDIKKVLKMI